VVFLHGAGQVQLDKQWSAANGGMHLISLPLRPLTGDLSQLLGIPADQLLAARWQPRLGVPNKYQIWPRMDAPIPGRGYWLRIFDDVDLSLTGVLEPEGREYIVPLDAGWNQIGSPRQSAVAVADLMFEAGGEQPISYADAVAGGIIQDGVYGWTRAEGYVQVDSLRQFEGYFIRCMRAQGALGVSGRGRRCHGPRGPLRSAGPACFRPIGHGEFRRPGGRRGVPQRRALRCSRRAGLAGAGGQQPARTAGASELARPVEAARGYAAHTH
jgi:hypothetical protein